MTEFLKRKGRPSIAYNYGKGRKDKPTLVFLGGFRSDMMGTKASFLERQAQDSDLSFLRFDYSGHGQSEGDFGEGTITLWRQDAKDIIESVTQGPVILIGSSMGGWISLLLALQMPEKVQGLIGIAAAPDFTLWIEEKMNKDQQRDIDQKGYFLLDSDYGEPYKITKNLLEDGRMRALLSQKIKVDCPVRLLQGKKDKDVPWQTAEHIAQCLMSKDVQIYYQPEGTHSFSTPEDMNLLWHTVQDFL